MAVEKMAMANLIGRVSQVDRIVKKVILLGSLHIVDAMEEAKTTDLALEVSDKNKDILIDLNYIRPFSDDRKTPLGEKAEQIKNIGRGVCKKYKLKEDDLIFDFDELSREVERLSSDFKATIDELALKQSRREKCMENARKLKLLEDIDVPLEELLGMKNFSFILLKLSKEGLEKLDHNSENIPAMFFHLKEEGELEYVGAVVPEDFREEVNRVLKSLNCDTIALEIDCRGKPKEALETMESEIQALDRGIERLRDGIEATSEKDGRDIAVALKSIELEEKYMSIRKNIAFSEDFFFLFGWIPERDVGRLGDAVTSLKDETVFISKPADESYRNPIPTKLKNSFISRPFESIVNMYGVPSYKEIDPTSFLAFSYMGLFGAMFGDTGQGALLFIAGILIKKYRGMVNSGEIMSRLGLSSMIFGTLYGTVFGFETVIPSLVIRPMENIMDILIYAVLFGLVLLLSSYALSIGNSIKKRDLEYGLLGKDGLAGLLLYVAVIAFGLSAYRGIELMPGALWASAVAIPFVSILMREPLANLIKQRRPLFSGSKLDYFIEGGFGMVELALSMFTNTLSFIRVGAFALTHVGLFLAFSALASMVDSGIAKALVYIAGNIVIIGLEGLIVFIQGLRLEYYELFSKYYEGYGIPFEPVKLDIKDS